MIATLDQNAILELWVELGRSVPWRLQIFVVMFCFFLYWIEVTGFSLLYVWMLRFFVVSCRSLVADDAYGVIRFRFSCLFCCVSTVRLCGDQRRVGSLCDSLPRDLGVAVI